MQKDIAQKYFEIEAGLAKVADLLLISVVENHEPLVKIFPQAGIIPAYNDEYADMIPVLGADIYVRKTVYEKLLKVAEALRKIHAHYALKISYGFRTLEIQEKYFAEAMELCRKNKDFADFKSEEDLRDRAHWFMAYPQVAGHPTGGAVDVTLFDTDLQQLVDMGPGVDDFAAGKKVYYASPEVSADAARNRKLLRDLMVAEGFAPFDGEYWHFSYGDREWAAICKKTVAHYGQLSLEEAKKQMV